MHPFYFDDIPAYGRLIHLPKSTPHFQVHELIEYGDEIMRNPVGRAWRQGHIIMELPSGVFELVPMEGVPTHPRTKNAPPSGAAIRVPRVARHGHLCSASVH
ncbi:hypothetical protein C6Y40_11285 [Alteromonas alba]|jgi:hypothetical protein|uniref:Uncharacterized protein n=1 Tax=Alteromonas alba TaxID=2079529 RepID=A0A2S9VAK9_9ALTE|nr:hypothetical protein [Alteromonas alba]PRO73490.1 hypothetical protein C6Y40_11285 [Alteromonas alba]BBO27492.1 hypothetical protein AltI4_18800 [Alteromonas sp. I4]|tara:strand:- start:3963 stop:4268 length:306 start_codon:yes stop_codon:yes gene_type:complete